MAQGSRPAALVVVGLVMVLVQAAHGQPVQKLSDVVLERYFTNAELAAWMDEYVARCAPIARKFSIGKSVAGADLWVLEVSDKPGAPEPEPSFKLVANMHGDEPVGRQLLPALAEWLCAERGTDARATRLVEGMHLFLMPSMNPDGYARGTRNNANDVDLNRNFPDPIHGKGTNLSLTTAAQQPETSAVMAWTLGHRFTGAVALHEGAVVANYPYDGYPDGTWAGKGVVAASPDHDTFLHLARLYARHHSTMAQSNEFPTGVTNGARWYPLYGGMQDWDYLVGRCLDITLEINDDKWPRPEQLRGLWEANRWALVQLALAAGLGGVTGTVRSAAGSGQGAPLPATVELLGAGLNYTADPGTGFFSRPVQPGTWTLRVSHPGYQPFLANVTVPEDGSGVDRHLLLEPEGGAGRSREAGAGEGPGAAAAAAATPAGGDGGTGPPAAAAPPGGKAAAPASASSSGGGGAGGGPASSPGFRIQALQHSGHLSWLRLEFVAVALCLLGAGAAYALCSARGMRRGGMLPVSTREA